MLYRKLLAAGVALAVSAAVSDTASAGSGRWYRPCRPAYSAPTAGTWYRPQATVHALAPAAPAPQAAARSADQPPAPSGNGIVRRFSYEPATEPAAPSQDIAPVPASPPASAPPAYRPVPAVRLGGGDSGGPPRNPVERRLRPGRGWQR